MEKFYHCYSVVNHDGCEKMHFAWIVMDSGRRSSYEGLTETPGDPYQEGHIDSLFTAAEIEQFQKYMRARHPDTELYIEAAEIPTPYAPLGACGYGGGVDLYMLYKEEGYDLPFKVGGHFDMRDHWDGSCGCPNSKKFKHCPTCGQEVESWQKLMVVDRTSTGVTMERRLIHSRECLGIPAEKR
jgi:hypothetical protein